MPSPPLPAPATPTGRRPGGTSQAERLPADLLPQHLQLDARTLPELLAYVARFSEKIQFYTDPAGPAAGPWALARHRGLLLLAVVAAHPSGEQAAQVQLRPLRDPAAGPTPHRLARRHLLKLLHEQARTLHGWHAAWLAGAQLPELGTALGEAIARVALALRQAAYFERLLAAQGTGEGAPRLAIIILAEGSPFRVGLTDEWLKREYGEYVSLWQPDETELERAAITETLRQLFWRLEADLLALTDVARRALHYELAYRQNHHPDEALLVAFLRLYAYAQTALNDIPRRHLDHYYQQVLGVTGRATVPDRAYLAFTLAPGVATMRLPAGTQVEAGKDARGRRIVFATTEAVTLGGWRVASLASVLKTSAPGQPGLVTGLHVAHPAPPAAQPAAPGTAPKPLWGSEPARVGFAVAASLLHLQEGTRTLTLRLVVTPTSFAQWQRGQLALEQAGHSARAAAQAAFVAQVTGATGWLPLTTEAVSGDEATRTITWTLTLGRDQPATVGYQPAVHGDHLATTQPVVRLLLAPHAPVYAYASFAPLQPVAVQLRVQVADMHEVALSNQDGRLTNGQPFYPFGTSALPGSYLLLGVPELLRKTPTWVAITLAWQNLPPEGFAAYYRRYQLPPGAAPYDYGDEQPLINGDFQVTPAYQADYHWQPLPPQPLFQTIPPSAKLRGQTVLRWPRLAHLTPAPGSQAGLLRIELTGPAEGFGTRLYPQALQAAVAYNGLFYSQQPPDGPRWPLPPPPYQPQLHSLSLAYAAEAELDLTQEPDTGAAAAFFHLSPFGSYAPGRGGVGLLPDFAAEGELLVGLSAEATGQRVQLAFDLHTPGPAWPTLEWAYLRNDHWVPIGQHAASARALPGVGNSLGVAVQLPALPNTHQTQLPAGLWWLRARVKSGAHTLTQMPTPHAQLVLAVRAAKGPGKALAAPYQGPVPAHTPVRLLVPQRALAGVTLPQASFGGRTTEDQSAYYTRVSERLRHRARALTPWDYEHLVLEEFPQVHSALCLNARDQPPPRVPGQVMLVLLPHAPADPGTWPQLGAGTLEAVRQYVQALAPPAVRVQVQQASYEPVQVRCKVVFQPSATLPMGRCEQRLNQDLQTFLSPWHQLPARGGFHHYLTVPDVEAYLRQRPYVADITGFSVVKTGMEAGLHRLYDSATDPHQPPYRMGAAPPGGVQVPARQHHFTVGLAPPAPEPASPTGVGSLRVGTDFIVACDF